MQTRDHKALALCLVHKTDNAGLRRHKRAFLLGCVEPDYNLPTYLRGLGRHKAFQGHNAENVEAHIRKALHRLQRRGLRSTYSYFTLGTLLHYVADTFTFPHSAAFSGSMAEHAAYERELHPVFSARLKRADKPLAVKTHSVWSFFQWAHHRYGGAPHTMETDCDYILSVCATVLEELLQGPRALPSPA